MPPRLRLLAAAALLLAVLAACSGTSCDDLPRLQAQRDAERAEYLEFAQSGASPQDTAVADEELHTLERQVYDAEQRCGD